MEYTTAPATCKSAILGDSTMIDKNFASGGIDAFLTFIRESESLYRQAEMNEQDANDQSQDLLHTIELKDCDDGKLLDIAKSFRDVRRERRGAKDAMDMLTAVKEWADANRAVIKGLEQLLGKVRKAEKNTENRIYTFKSDKTQM